MERINAVSFSRMLSFETCPFQAYLKFCKKIAEPPDPPGVESPLDRGSRVHTNAEEYVLGKATLCKELTDFEEDLHALHLRHRRSPETIAIEQMWCFDLAWQPVEWNDWDNVWMRVKQDAVVFKSPTEVLAIDYKTGKKKGNEVKHNTQLRVGLLGARFKYPDIDTFHAENWYTDQDAITSFTYTAQDIDAFFPELNKRLLAVTEATSFDPTPSAVACKWCAYKTGNIGRKKKGTGDCSQNPDRR